MDNNFYPTSEFFNKAKAIIEQHQKIIIFGHVQPDGDCIGSQICLYYSLKEQYPNKEIYFPFAKKDFSNFLLPKNYQNEIDAKTLEGALCIVVDQNTRSRLPITIPEENFIILIDHHPNTEKNFGNLVWVDDQSSACCELIYFFLNAVGFPINTNAATALLLGIITDSGNFGYSNVNNITFWVASKLMEKGAKLQMIHKKLGTKQLIDLKMEAYFLSNLVEKEKLLYFTFNPSDKTKIPEAGKIVDPFARKVGLLGGIKGINIWASFSQVNEVDFIEGSIRSVKKIDVIKVVTKYGGGGHKNAAGIKTKDWTKIQELIADLVILSEKN